MSFSNHPYFVKRRKQAEAFAAQHAKEKGYVFSELIEREVDSWLPGGLATVPEYELIFLVENRKPATEEQIRRLRGLNDPGLYLDFSQHPPDLVSIGQYHLVLTDTKLAHMESGVS